MRVLGARGNTYMVARKSIRASRSRKQIGQWGHTWSLAVHKGIAEQEALHIRTLALIRGMAECNTHNRAKIQEAKYATHVVARSTTRDSRRHCNTGGR